MKMLRSKTTVQALLCLAIGGCATAQTPCPSAAEAPPQATHYALPGLQHGLMQSPVNVLSGETVDLSHRVRLFEGDSAKQVTNKGHTVEVEFPEGTVVDFDAERYSLLQVHFHTPSEHRIDGVTYPMEVHAVNLCTSCPQDEPPRYLVAAVLYRMGKPSEFVASFIDAIPTQAGREQALEGGKVRINTLFPGKVNPAFYHYRGSLTTPPYSETVDWLIDRKVRTASEEQIRTLNMLEGDNARHIQGLHGRTVDD